MIAAKERYVYVLKGVPRRDLIAELALFILWAIVIVFAAFLTPNPDGHGTHMQIGLGPCPWLAIYDKPCPTCGMTTCFSAILNGDFALALKAHALGPFVFLWFAIAAIYYGSKFFFGYRIIAPVRPILVFNLSLLGVFLAYGVWRMMP